MAPARSLLIAEFIGSISMLLRNSSGVLHE